MPRVRYIEKSDMEPEHQHVYEEIAGSRGGVNRNFQALLNSPLATSNMAAMGAYVRFETPLPPRVKALAVLTTAREADGDYVWTVNVSQAASAGVEEEVIKAINERRAPQGLDAEDAAIVKFTQELLRQHRVSDATFQPVKRRLGDSGVVDLLVLIGYYNSLSHALSALEVELQPGVTSALNQ